MAAAQLSKVVRQLRAVLARQDTAGLTEAELWKRYIAEGDEAAFETLVRRHGPMVLGVCRRILGNEQDAEDAFQATFLVSRSGLPHGTGGEKRSRAPPRSGGEGASPNGDARGSVRRTMARAGPGAGATGGEASRRGRPLRSGREDA